MGNSSTTEDYQSQNPSGATIMEVSLKLQNLKRIIFELNVSVNQLKHMPYVQEVNNINEGIVNQLLQNLASFTEDVQNLKKFLYPSFTVTSNQTVSPCVQRLEQQNQFMEGISDAVAIYSHNNMNNHQKEINQSHYVQKVNKGAHQISQFFSIIYEPVSDQQESDLNQKKQPQMIVEQDENAEQQNISSQDKVIKLLSQIPQTNNQVQEPDKQYLIDKNFYIQISQLKQQNIKLRQIITKLEEDKHYSATKIIQLQRKLQEEKQSIARKASQLRDISLFRSISEINFSNMLEHI